jgi:glutaconyl-CoA/methylmalonyl-CoA decarboxylase subunit gamma
MKAMKKFKFTIKGHQYEVDILNVENGTVELEVNGTHYSVEIHKEVKTPPKTPKLVRSPLPPPKPEEAAIAKEASEVLYPVKAPLPGVILKILVKPGDAVKPGDTLIIMEAMKMENNIQADKKGVVRALKVSEGDAVLQNDALLLIS